MRPGSWSWAWPRLWAPVGWSSFAYYRMARKRVLRGSLGTASCMEGFTSSFVRKLTVSSGVWLEVSPLGGGREVALPGFREPEAFGPAQGDRAGGSGKAQGHVLG